MKTFIQNIWSDFVQGKYRRDILFAILLGIAFAIGVYHGSKLVPEYTVGDKYWDEWFQGDSSVVYNNMIKRESDHSRVKTHPIFLLAAYSPVFLLKFVFGLEPVVAVRLVISGVAFCWMAGLFALLRTLGCCRFDAVLFSFLAAVSAASMFWFTVPETFSFGSLAILIVLLTTALSCQHIFSSLWYVLMNIISMGIIITNWMVGILATLVANPFKRACHIFAYAFSVTVLLWGAQKYIFPGATFFLGERDDPWNFINPQSIESLRVSTSFFYHTLIMPTINLVSDGLKYPRYLMLTQLSDPGSAMIWGKIAVVLWTILLILGLWALIYSKGNLKFRLVLAVALVGQLGLHLFYGPETFLYSLHFIILLIPLVALGSLSRLRPLILALLILLLPCVAINNALQFRKAINFFYENKMPYKLPVAISVENKR